MVGTFDGTTWTLTGEGASGAEYALAGFDVDELGFEVVLSPTTFTGTRRRRPCTPTSATAPTRSTSP